MIPFWLRVAAQFSAMDYNLDESVIRSLAGRLLLPEVITFLQDKYYSGIEMAKSDKTQISETPIIYQDKAFKSRTIVLEDRRAFQVDKSRIEANDPALIAHLDKHAEFERIVSGE